MKSSIKNVSTDHPPHVIVEDLALLGDVGGPDLRPEVSLQELGLLDVHEAPDEAHDAVPQADHRVLAPVHLPHNNRGHDTAARAVNAIAWNTIFREDTLMKWSMSSSAFTLRNISTQLLA